MTSVNTITVSGNLTADPELRRTSAEVPFARMRVAVSRRVQNTETKEWEDRQDGFFNVTAWRDLGQHAATALRKGDRVTVVGRMMRRPYEADLGEGKTETRYTHESEAEELGPSLRWQAWTRLEPRPVATHQDHGDDTGSTADGTPELAARAA